MMQIIMYLKMKNQKINLSFITKLFKSIFSKKIEKCLISISKVSRDVQKNVQLIVTGRLSDKEKLIAPKSNNIMIINEILNKEGVYKL